MFCGLTNRSLSRPISVDWIPLCAAPDRRSHALLRLLDAQMPLCLLAGLTRVPVSSFGRTKHHRLLTLAEFCGVDYFPGWPGSVAAARRGCASRLGCRASFSCTTSQRDSPQSVAFLAQQRAQTTTPSLACMRPGSRRGDDRWDDGVSIAYRGIVTQVTDCRTVSE